MGGVHGNNKEISMTERRFFDHDLSIQSIIEPGDDGDEKVPTAAINGAGLRRVA